MNIADILRPEHVLLSLSATDKLSAINEVLLKMNGDERVRDFDALDKAVHERDAPSIEDGGIGICIAHGRTETVSSLILAVGRLTEGIKTSEISSPLRLVFVAGIPGAYRSEYLRIVGAIARVCRDHHQVQRLMAAKTSAHFIELLTEGELRL